MSTHPRGLQWPPTRPRTARRKQGKFRTDGSPISVAGAIRRLTDEIDRLGGRNAHLSTDLETRLDGMPRSGAAEPRDPGAVVFFDLGKDSIVFCCDTYDRVAQNIAAMAAHIGAVRAQTRYGVVTANEALRAFVALTDQSATDWRQILAFGGADTITRDTIVDRFRHLSKSCHPDTPDGSSERWSRLNSAYQQALEFVSQT